MSMMIHIAGHQVPFSELFALMWFLGAWFGYSHIAGHVGDKKRNLLSLIDHYRLAWMQQMLKREIRIADMTAVGNLQRSIAFLASTSIFLALGLLTLFRYRDEALTIIDSIPFATHQSTLMWEFKIFMLTIIFIYAFFKFTWSLRQYNYVCIFISAAPAPDESLEQHGPFAECGSKLMSNAANHFNLGLRAYYYGLATLSWFVHGYVFMAATTLVVWILYRREFHSFAYGALSKLDIAPTGNPDAA